MSNETKGVDLKSAAQNVERKLFIETYGCQMNVADSEVVASIMEMDGYAVTNKIEEADAIFVNTCSVRDNAEQKVLGRLQYFQSLKRKKRTLIIGVLGCMAERVKEELISNHGVDLVVGPDSYMDLPNLVGAVEHGEKAINVELSTQETYKDVIPLKIGGINISGFISIMRGCNNFCTYCIVPYVRGREKSRPFEEIVDEVTGLVRQGVREITLLGQNVNSYGRDLFGKPRFADLLRAVGDTGVERIFFTSSHPKDLLPETIDAMAETPAVMPQLHLAVQSGSTRILKEMNRRYTREDYLGLVDRIRNRMPDIALSTDIIVGFPGETEEDFEQTLSLAETVRYAQAYTFIYSKRAGTPAAEIDDPTPHEVILERFNRLVKVIETTAHEYNQGELHTVVPALIEGTSKKNDAVLLGKSPKDIRDAGVHLSFVPEDRLGMGLVGTMGMTDNMMLKSYGEGRSPLVDHRAPRELAEKIRKELGVVTPGLNTPVSRLSGGNVQKVLVGRELAASPIVLMTAYAVRGLDINTSYTIYNLLNEQKEKGVAVLYVGEDLDVLLELCDRILVLCGGKANGMLDARTTTKEEVGLRMTNLVQKEGK